MVFKAWVFHRQDMACQDRRRDLQCHSTYCCRVIQHVLCLCEGDLNQPPSWLPRPELHCNMAAPPEGGVIDSASNNPQSPTTLTHSRTHTLTRSYPVDKAMLDRATAVGGKVMALNPYLHHQPSPSPLEDSSESHTLALQNLSQSQSTFPITELTFLLLYNAGRRKSAIHVFRN